MYLPLSDQQDLKEIRDIMFEGTPALTVYLGAMETATTDDTTHVTVDNTIRKVQSVWLDEDDYFEQTNYYADPDALNFTGKQITLDSALPSATSVAKVAYYADCPDCDWNPVLLTGGDPSCSTCGGIGMVLELGDAIEIPIRKMKATRLNELQGTLGDTLSGILIGRIKQEQEAILRAAMKIIYDNQELSPMGKEDLYTSKALFDISGVRSLVEIVLRYKQLP